MSKLPWTRLEVLARNKTFGTCSGAMVMVLAQGNKFVCNTLLMEKTILLREYSL